MTLGSTQPLTEMSTRNLPACKSDNPTAICEPDCLENVGISMSRNPIDLQGLLQFQIYLRF
jgi:hypothetical protein